MINLKKILLSLCSLSFLYAEELMQGYIYPIDTIYHEGILKMCVLYQKQNGLELYFWDPATHKATLGLLSFFQPTSLTVLPNKAAFSFIDNDRIKIKYVDKRSPKALDLYGPYDLTTITWVDNQNFYFSAKERGYHNLFHANVEGDLFRLTVSNHNHYLYPQRVADKLFFIEQTESNEFALKSIDYPTEAILYKTERSKEPLSLEEEVQSLMVIESTREMYKPLLDIESATTLLFFSKKIISGAAIAFLHMISLTEGFFIRYADHIDKDQKILFLDYYSFYEDLDGWNYKFLFTFSVPLYFIIHQKDKIMMNESILPFLPFHDNETIYFTSYDEDEDSLELYEYNKEDKTAKKSIFVENHNKTFFSPRRFNKKLICGGNILSYKKPLISLNNDGTQYFDMPIKYK